MHPGRSARLIACILLVLLIGWVVRRWRVPVSAEEIEQMKLEESWPKDAADIDLPRE